MPRRPRPHKSFLRDYRHEYGGVCHNTEEYVPGCLLCENEVMREALTKIAGSENPRQAESGARAVAALVKIKRANEPPSIIESAEELLERLAPDCESEASDIEKRPR